MHDLFRKEKRDIALAKATGDALTRGRGGVWSRQAALSHGAGWGVATLDDDVDDGMMMMMMSQGCGPAFPLAGPLYPSNCLFNSGESCA